MTSLPAQQLSGRKSRGWSKEPDTIPMVTHKGTSQFGEVGLGNPGHLDLASIESKCVLLPVQWCHA